MKAEELRIGNLCKEITHSSNGSVRVSKRHFEDIEKGEIDLFPIPLSEEYLLKFGFEKLTSKKDGFKSNTYSLRSPCLIIYLNDDNTWDVTFWQGGKRQYVHQLQNLYHALIGEELPRFF